MLYPAVKRRRLPEGMGSRGTTRAAAPGRLELARTFVNTCDLESEEDALSSPAALAKWFAARDLLAVPRKEQPTHLSRAIAVREALRSLLVANNGGPIDSDAPAILEAAARAAKLELHVASNGRAELVPTARGTAGALGALLAIVTEAMAAGTWDRLKACRAETCRWAFYDHSPNRSRIWCSMAVCGQRQRVRASRARRASL